MTITDAFLWHGTLYVVVGNSQVYEVSALLPDPMDWVYTEMHATLARRIIDRRMKNELGSHSPR